MTNDAEEKTIHAFVVGSRQARLLAVLSKPDRSRRLYGVLPHPRLLDERFMSHIAPSQSSPSDVGKLLRSRGAPGTCHVLGGALDGRSMDLDKALTEIVGSNEGCIVICLPGRLAYFEGEEKNQRYVLHRGEDAEAPGPQLPS